MNKQFLLITILGLILFGLSCDTRTIDYTDTSISDVVELRLETDDPFFTLQSTSQLRKINAIPLDASNGEVGDITILYELLDGEIGYLSTDEESSDSTISLTIMYGNHNPPEGEVVFGRVVGKVKNSAITDTLIFSYQDASTAETGLTVWSLFDTIPYAGMNYSPVYAILKDSSGNPAPNVWIEFESKTDSSGLWVDFGSMSPEMAKTNPQGIAQSNYLISTQTGFGRIFANTADYVADYGDTSIIYVNSGEAITMEILPPEPDNEIMVIGGGGTEAAEIAVNIVDGNGNLVNEDYIIVFTIPCPFYPIDGNFCPEGDGIFNNDVRINGIIQDNQIPQDTLTTVNGSASITINSGNKPGPVKLHVELFEVEDSDFSNAIFEAEEIPITIVTGPPVYGEIGVGYLEADTIGAGFYEIPIAVSLWDEWANPVADCTNVWFTIFPEDLGSIIGEAKTGNPSPSTGNSYPGIAWTTMIFESEAIIESPTICAQTYSTDNFLQVCTGADDAGGDYIHPCVDCNLSIVPLGPTEHDFCGNALYELIVGGTLLDAYNIPVSGAQVQLVVYSAQEFTILPNDDDPPELPAGTTLTDGQGNATWTVQFTDANCWDTDADPDEFDYECSEPLITARLLDPNPVQSEDEINITLRKTCE